MAATLQTMREGLATNLRTAVDFQVSPYILAAPTLPSAQITVEEISYHRTMGSVASGLHEVTFSVRVFHPAAIDQAAQQKLDESVSSGEIPTALESDKTLGGLVHDVQVLALTSYERVLINENTEAYMAAWSVQVLA